MVQFIKPFALLSIMKNEHIPKNYFNIKNQVQNRISELQAQLNKPKNSITSINNNLPIFSSESICQRPNNYEQITEMKALLKQSLQCQNEMKTNLEHLRDRIKQLHRTGSNSSSHISNKVRKHQSFHSKTENTIGQGSSPVKRRLYEYFPDQHCPVHGNKLSQNIGYSRKKSISSSKGSYHKNHSKNSKKKTSKSKYRHFDRKKSSKKLITNNSKKFILLKK